jgi:hypothetical protein
LDELASRKGRRVIGFEIGISLVMLYVLLLFVMAMKGQLTLRVITWFSQNTNLAGYLPPYFKMIYNLRVWTAEGWMKWLKERGIE